MRMMSNGSKTAMLIAMLAVPVAGPAMAQQSGEEVLTTVYGSVPTEGPEIEGIITARDDRRLQVTSEDGSSTIVSINDETQIRGTGGFLGLGRDQLSAEALLNGLPVSVKTMQWDSGLVASQIKFRNKDLKTATMIRNGTAQQFAAQGAAIDENSADISQNAEGISENAAATAALKSRFGDIGEYNVKGVTNVYFGSGRSNLSPQARTDLCSVASQADAIDNSLMLVVGYTDSTGSYEVNQALSEKRAGRVVNYLQQQCGWKPYRMLSPTGMASSDPMASNDTAAGKAQNRRVSVNILVSKALDEQ